MSDLVFKTSELDLEHYNETHTECGMWNRLAVMDDLSKSKP